MVSEENVACEIKTPIKSMKETMMRGYIGLEQQAYGLIMKIFQNVRKKEEILTK